jgi:hypothetical protein
MYDEDLILFILRIKREKKIRVEKLNILTQSWETLFKTLPNIIKNNDQLLSIKISSEIDGQINQ